jgi:hypothetical protein
MIWIANLLCVIPAGVYGAATVSRRILYVQGHPARLLSFCSGWSKGLRCGGIHPAFVDLNPLTFSARLSLHCSNGSATLRPAMAPGTTGQDHRHNHRHEEAAL